MKSIVCHRYGSPSVLKLEEVQKPTHRDKGCSPLCLNSSLQAAFISTEALAFSGDSFQTASTK